MKITGKYLNRINKIDARDGKYHKDGSWYHPLRLFPGTLWDGPPYGYVRFETEDDFKKCPLLTIHPSGDVTAPKDTGIAAIPGYVRVS